MRSELRAGALALLLALDATCAVRAARAEAAVEEPAEYRDLLSAALLEYESAHFAESRALMLRAHTLYPNARTLRGLGMVSFELREYVESVRYFEAALASTERALTPELRVETEGLLARARSFTGRVRVQVTPADSELAVDGAFALRGPGELTLSVGEHVLHASAPGHQREQRRLVLSGGDVHDVTLTLAPDASRAFALTPTPPAQDEPHDRRRRRWLWGTLGAALVAGAITGVAIAFARRDPGTEPAYRGLSGEMPLTGPGQ